MSAALLIVVIAVMLGALLGNLGLESERPKPAPERPSGPTHRAGLVDPVTRELISWLPGIYKSVLREGLSLRPITDDMPAFMPIFTNFNKFLPVGRDTNLFSGGGMPVAHHAHWYGGRSPLSVWKSKTTRLRRQARAGQFWAPHNQAAWR